MIKAILLILIIIILFFVIVMVADCHRFVIKEYTCISPKLQKDGNFVLLSDLHNTCFGKDNDRLFHAIEKINPDAILIAGDMYTAAKEDHMRTADFVCRLAQHYPVYYGNGNHEQKTRVYPGVFGTMYEEYMTRIKAAGVNVLVNERVNLPPYRMDICGLEIGREYYGKFVTPDMDKAYIDRLIGRASEDRFSLLIAHNPDYFEAYADWGADLVVSGHVHGGLMVLPVLGGVISPKLCLFPKYDGGEFKTGNSTMILGRGLGTHTLPIRIFNPGELVVLHLRRKDG